MCCLPLLHSRRVRFTLYCITNSKHRIVDDAIQGLESIDLNHLRRLVKPEYLPVYLQKNEDKEQSGSLGNNAVDSPRSTDVEVASPLTECNGQSPILHFLACATSVVSRENLQSLLFSTLPCSVNGLRPCIRVIEVPSTPPTSHDQAEQFSQQYWPTVYKGGNSFGPHPSIFAHATEEIQHDAKDHMVLAMHAGLATSFEAKGEPIGAVIVDRSYSKGPIIVVVAGDARWNNVTKPQERASGNVMAHAVMRAIGMVAKRRLALTNALQAPAMDGEQLNSFSDEPLTPLERDIYSRDVLAPGGYLCLDLELYLTHEPCVMCSMAILHSRFGKVVFGQRLPRTGGLTANIAGSHDSSTGDPSSRPSYSLWWYPKSIWKLLAWEWAEKDPPQASLSEQDIQA